MHRTIQLNATGETITFTKSTSDTNGDFVETIVSLPASGEGPPKHKHVFQTELFEAMEGRLGLDYGDQKMVLEPGQSFTIPANGLHRCYSVDGNEIKFKATFMPALGIEYLLSEMFDACNRNHSKDPSVFDACFILAEIKGEYYLAEMPTFMQKILFQSMAFIGKLFGLIKAKSNADWQMENMAS